MDLGLIVLMNWQQAGYMMVIYIAAIQSIPTEMVEAAKIDGANGWKIIKNSPYQWSCGNHDMHFPYVNKFIVNFSIRT
jgi:hypothetical protein